MLVATVFTICLALACALPQTSKEGEPKRSELECKLQPDASVEYSCQSDGRAHSCNDTVPHGAVVRPACKLPFYYTPTALADMRCTGGQWDYVAKCIPECGRVTPNGAELNIGKGEKRGDVPWYAAIYTKTTRPYMQICGGSLVSTKTVITAAHCFWKSDDGVQPAQDYAVALGKVYRPWSNPQDQKAQYFNISEVHIPIRFRGEQTNFASNIAVVTLDKEVVYTTSVRPVCLNFDRSFDKKQLESGNLGKIAGWSLGPAGNNDKPSPVLRVAELPFVPYTQCYNEVPMSFREYITQDVFCAGSINGITPCKGDGGGGLAFPENDRGIQRYYLRGVASTGPVADVGCSAYTLFTQVSFHEDFIKDSLSQ